jgi:ADP-ribosyl-[dinitrogen reductase] hydrolase
MEQVDRILGGLWGAVVGDALGVPVEFTSRDERKRDPVTGMRGYGTHRLPAGTWSDDSSMLLCTVEALCETDYRLERLAELFVAWAHEAYWTPYGQVFDIGIATRAAIGRIAAGVTPEEAGGVGDYDNGNGSLMRILPVALRWRDPDEVVAAAGRISAITHRHPRSQMACGVYCLIAKGLLNGMTVAEACAAVAASLGRHFSCEALAPEASHFARLMSADFAATPESAIKSDGYVVHTLEAAVWCLLTTKSFEEAVLKAVNLGFDTDTTACAAGGLAGLAYGFKAIPGDWIDAIARRDDIEELFKKFCARVA